MTEYLLILIGAIFVNNNVMVKTPGLCPHMGVSKKLETTISMGAATNSLNLHADAKARATATTSASRAS